MAEIVLFHHAVIEIEAVKRRCLDLALADLERVHLVIVVHVVLCFKSEGGNRQLRVPKRLSSG